MQSSSQDSEIVNILDSTKEMSELLKDIKDFIDGRSLIHLTEAGLMDEIVSRFKDDDSLKRQKCMLILDEILPRLPSDIEEVLNIDVEKETKDRLSIETALELENFADACLSLVIEKCVNIFKNTNYIEAVHRVFIKLLTCASCSKIKENREMLLKIVRFHLYDLCHERSRVGIAAVMTMMKRMPPDFIYGILVGNDMFAIGILCKLSDRTRAFFDEKRLVDNFYNVNNFYNEGNCRTLLQDFYGGGQNATSTFISYIPTFRLSENEFLFAKLLDEYFEPQLRDVVRGRNEGSTRAFLNGVTGRMVNEYGPTAYTHWLFERLVDFVKRIISSLVNYYNQICEDNLEVEQSTLKFKFKGCDCPFNTSEENDCNYVKLMRSMLTILNQLYKLNYEWGRWFDFALFDPWINLDYFVIPELVSLRHFDNMLIWICPVAFSIQEKWKLLQDTDLKTFLNAKRKKVIVRRPYLLDDFMRVSCYPRDDKIYKHLDVEFDGEIGKGPGIKREFFSRLSKEFQRHDLGMWLGEPGAVDRHEFFHFSQDSSHPLYTFLGGGLFPNKNASEKSIRHFYYFGQMMAMALIDKCYLDIPLSVEFFKYMFASSRNNFTKKYFDVVKIRPNLAQFVENLLKVRMKKLQIHSIVDITEEEKHELIGNLEIEDGCTFDQLDVSFVVPGTDVEMKVNGANIQLDPFNVEEYLDCLGEVVMNLDQCLPSSSVKVEFRRGFNAIFPINKLAVFTPDELNLLFCGYDHKAWTIDYLKKLFVFNKGYDANSKPIEYLFNILSKFNKSEKRLFLRFVTGVPNESCFMKLKVSKIKVDNVDLKLPSSATCTNNLFLPEYSSIEIMKDRLMLAITDGCVGFSYV